MTNRGIFFNEKDYIPYGNTNLPKDHFTFTDRIPIYWQVELELASRDNKQVLIARVIDYEYKDTGQFNRQVKKSGIPRLIFEKLNPDGFFAKCVSYQLGQFEGLFIEPPPAAADSDYRPEDKWPDRPASNSQPGPREYSVEFKVKFSDAKIINGAIEFQRQMGDAGPIRTLEIENLFLKAPYETIKDFIAKKLGRKTFSVTARLKAFEGIVVVIDVQSEEIARIDETFIQEIKIKQIRFLPKIRPVEGKQVYPVDELLALSGELGGHVLDTKIEDIIQVLTNNYTYRNSKQLTYLANSHTIEEVLHLTVTPHFGFVFCLMTPSHRCYVWELLNTHATYIWRFKQDTIPQKQAFDLVEEAIGQIHQSGRNPYKTTYREGPANTPFVFHAIEHDEQDPAFGYTRWLAELKTEIGQPGG